MVGMKLKKKWMALTLAVPLSFGMITHSTMIHAQETKINIDNSYDTPSYIIEKWQAPSGLSKKEVVLSYLESNQEHFQLTDRSHINFNITNEQIDRETGTTHFKLEQLYKGIPIFGADQTITLDENKDVTAYFGKVIPAIETKNVAEKTTVSAAKAKEIAKAHIEKKIGEVKDYDGEVDAKRYLYEYKEKFYDTYLVTASTTQPSVGFWHYFVDASNGSIIDSYNAAHHVTAFGRGVFGDKQMFEAQAFNGMYRLFDITRGDGVVTYDHTTGTNVDITSLNKMFRDGSAVDAHANAQKTYDYYLDTFNRNSVDDNGQILISAVHVGHNWNNASWNGRQMSYGDGDGIRFHPLAGGLDVAAHEMSHGVVQHTAGLIYRNQSGALNESFADIFGAMVDRDDWLIGDAIMADGTMALRSMEDPTALIERRTQEPYPDHWDRRYTGPLDNGGVHINSSINNKAAYLVSEGGEHYDVEVNGVGRDVTEQIYYRALSLYLTSNSDFSMMRQAAIQAATDLYGDESEAVAAVEQAYNAVGVY
ncbi:peptidase M4 family protein [Virgibacillus salarius]|uniref:Neutral metalloproteinase n=2 Tax=Bacillaceae TaxID=186817 RepID=A0A941IDG8_9BACI|nr:M4 family metallopeptidase [Virgibacillus salarius]MBR7797115.1 peptidase M4 family protein [Virgibacillus salarius]